MSTTSLFQGGQLVEAIGVCDKVQDETSPSVCDVSLDIVFNGRRYDVSLPWKQDSLPLPNNYKSCNSRLLSLYQRLRNNPKLLSEYDKIIHDQLEAGIAERVPTTDSNSSISIGIHYSPHHPVIRHDKDTTKIRIVYDGSVPKKL